MGEAHDYRMRMIIKRRGALSTEFFPVTSKRAATLDPWLACQLLISTFSNSSIRLAAFGFTNSKTLDRQPGFESLQNCLSGSG
jgi:hypothetical protein